MDDESGNMRSQDMRQLSFHENEAENEVSSLASIEPSSPSEDEEDNITEQFQATVRKRGSVTVEKRSSRRQKQLSQEGNKDQTKQDENIFSPLNKFRAKQMKETKKNTIAMNAEHSRVLYLAADRMKTQLPRSLAMDIREEASAIVQSTIQAYNRLLGKKHKLTVEACEYLTSM